MPTACTSKQPLGRGGEPSSYMPQMKIMRMEPERVTARLLAKALRCLHWELMGFGLPRPAMPRLNSSLRLCPSWPVPSAWPPASSHLRFTT